MARFIVLVVIIAAITGCQKKEEPVISKPADAVLGYYAALNARDTAALLKWTSQTRDEYARQHPGTLQKVLDLWKDNHADVQILSVSEDGTVATVRYHEKITGKDPLDTIMIVQVYKEDSGWKVGYH